jgi:hypothetical protein
MNWWKKFRKTEEITEIHQKEVMEMAIRKLLQVQGTDFYRQKYLISYSDWTNISVCSGIMLKSKDTSVKKIATFNLIITSSLILRSIETYLLTISRLTTTLVVVPHR